MMEKISRKDRAKAGLVLFLLGAYAFLTNQHQNLAILGVLVGAVLMSD